MSYFEDLTISELNQYKDILYIINKQIDKLYHLLSKWDEVFENKEIQKKNK